MIKDYVTAKERLTFEPIFITDVYSHECTGCGRSSEEIVKEVGCSYIELEDEAIETNGGLWYCHIDCYRDSH